MNSLHHAVEPIEQAIRNAEQTWAETAKYWNDSTSRVFSDQYWQPCLNAYRDFLASAEDLAQVVEYIRREL